MIFEQELVDFSQLPAQKNRQEILVIAQTVIDYCKIRQYCSFNELNRILKSSSRLEKEKIRISRERLRKILEAMPGIEKKRICELTGGAKGTIEATARLRREYNNGLLALYYLRNGQSPIIPRTLS